MSIPVEQRFKNVFIDSTGMDCHDARLLYALWPEYYQTGDGFTRQHIITPQLAAFMDITQTPPTASRVECTNAITAYIKANKLQDPDNTRQIIPDPKLTIILGPFDTGRTSYYDLQKQLSKHILHEARAHTFPTYQPTPDLIDFVTNVALPQLNAEEHEQNDQDYMWDFMNYKNKKPIAEELPIIDAVAPTAILHYIELKDLQKVVVTVKYDKPLYDMLGKTADDTLTYDELAEILRAKMYPELATKVVDDTTAAADK